MLKFSEGLMFQKTILLLVFTLISCSQKTPIYAPVGGLGKEDLSISQNRAKQLNTIEREQITEWIKEKKASFYPTQLNYWIDVENLEQRQKKEDGTTVSYQYYIYDFDETLIYEQPKIQENVILGKFTDLDAVIDAVKLLNENEEATLLVPSVLAFGTYGDGDQIPHDMPLIIKLKLLK